MLAASSALKELLNERAQRVGGVHKKLSENNKAARTVLGYYNFINSSAEKINYFCSFKILITLPAENRTLNNLLFSHPAL
jgi:hypothetical protein